ncbi:MAG: F0F1 ATP synthase subunit gamma [Candidatus Dependentiae bacterium]|nr:F0F1 ATP synthase subunit gamma [Candidatus Dependentiae bacterium]
MSLIMLLRQRIKTVEAIHKMTHAMRLTSRSTHAILNKKKQSLETYRRELERILQIVKTDSKTQQAAPNEPPEAHTTQDLIIVVGSQKGLCGAFNTRLYRYFMQEQEQRAPSQYAIIAIGKKMSENLDAEHQLLYTFNAFNPANFFVVTDELYQHIVGPARYQRVTIYSSYPQSFFVQRPMVTSIEIPQPSPASTTILPVDACEPAETVSGYQYDEPPATILEKLERLYVKVHVEEVLFESLIAEHAARFISMDASTTNAEKLLVDMRRDYNKLRQASITRELMDLMSGLL